MIEDDYGFMHPQINQDICISCGACRNVCPVVRFSDFHKEIIVYAAVSRNSSIYVNSTSGGVATTLSKSMIEDNGIVYGAAFDNKFNLKHQCANSINNLDAFQGSKYVQSYIGESFKKIKEELSTKKVLFIGTPCQVAGLLNYIPSLYKKKLITISFICGGVPSVKFLKQSLNGFLSGAKKLRFRNGKEYGFWIESDNREDIYLERFYSQYFRAFDNKLSLRNSCYNCKFACRERVGDITIGDFWGLKDDPFFKAFQDGISIIICSTEKGKSFIDHYKHNFILREHSILETLECNPRLLSPAEKTKDVIKFRVQYRKKGNFNVAVNSVLNLRYRVYEIKKNLKQYRLLRYLHNIIKK